MTKLSAKLFESDLYLLKEVFFNDIKVGVFFDPENNLKANYETDYPIIKSVDELVKIAEVAPRTLLFNLSDEDLPKDLLNSFAGIISYQKEKCNKTLFELCFLLGKYDTFRYVFPKTLTKPYYYNVLHQNYDYPIYNQKIDALAFKLGFHKMVSDDSIYVYKKNDFLINQWNHKTNDFFLFTENYIFEKLGSCFILNNEGISSEIKFGDSELAFSKLSNEQNILKEIAKISPKLTVLQHAKVLKEGINQIELSNNWPSGGKNTELIESIHINCLAEVYRNYLGAYQIKDFLVQENSLNMIKTFKVILDEQLHPKGLSAEHIEVLCLNLINLINKLNPQEPIYHSLYHGSFIPENLPIKDDKLHLNNWDKGLPKMPLLFDFFDFIFIKLEKSEQPTIAALDDMMRYFLKNSATLDLIKEHEIKFKVNLALYHIYHVITQLERYIKQRFIHPNANFKLKFWIESLERLNHNEL